MSRPAVKRIVRQDRTDGITLLYMTAMLCNVVMGDARLYGPKKMQGYRAIEVELVVRCPFRDRSWALADALLMTVTSAIFALNRRGYVLTCALPYQPSLGSSTGMPGMRLTRTRTEFGIGNPCIHG